MPRGRDDGLIAGAAVAALVFLIWRNARARPTFELDIRFPGFEPGFDYPHVKPDDAVITPPQTPTLPAPAPTASGETNVVAFLQMIRFAEHKAADVQSGADFGTFFGGSRFTNFSDHPALTGEKRGVRLSDTLCRQAGLGPGCVSTAAGAYQINVPTWRQFREAGAWGPRLPDFTPASQMEAARRILDFIGAGPLIRAGDLAGAVAAARGRWASLPGNPGARSAEFVLAQYENAGGNLA